MSGIPQLRIRTLNGAGLREDASFVLYWMIAGRRTRFNFALQHAVDIARRLDKPLVVLEALRADYPWASERFHRFVLDGMQDNQERCRKAGVSYHAYVEPRRNRGRGLLGELSRHACAVITDDYPAFFLRGMTEAAATKSRVRFEAVDSNGLLPLAATDRAFPTAHSFRRFLQRELPAHLGAFPAVDPLARSRLRRLPRLPASIRERWPSSFRSPLEGSGPAAVAYRGGPGAARSAMLRFVRARLDTYDEQRNRVDGEATSGLSPYLHFGHISAHEIFRRIVEHEEWTPLRLGEDRSGSRSGWWGMRPSAEAFLDQLVTWRELGFNMCRHRDDYDRYESLPDWALRTLDEHSTDPREHLYTLEQFDDATTHDPIWNAAQRQLRQDGTIHNYLRMLWGKKILEWSPTPREALATMIELNNRYALDGRDPNSYSGIFWVLGRYDRAWGPERSVFGKVRYMSSANTARKMNLAAYLERYGG